MRIIASIALAVSAVHGSLSVASECNSMIREARIEIEDTKQSGKELIMSIINEYADSDIVLGLISDTNSGLHDRLQRLESDLLQNDCFNHREIFESFASLQDSVNTHTEAFGRHMSSWSFVNTWARTSIERVRRSLPDFERETADVARKLHDELMETLTMTESQLGDMDWDTRSFLSTEYQALRRELSDMKAQLTAAKNAAVARWENGAETRRANQQLKRQEIEEQEKEFALNRLRDIAKQAEKKILAARWPVEAEEALRTFETATVTMIMEQGRIYSAIAGEVEDMARKLLVLKMCVDSVAGRIQQAEQAIAREISPEAVFEVMVSGSEDFVPLENQARSHIPSAASLMADLDASCRARVEHDIAHLNSVIQTRIAELSESIRFGERYHAHQVAATAVTEMHAAEAREDMEEIASQSIAVIESMISGREAQTLISKLERERDGMRGKLGSRESANQCKQELEAAIRKAHEGLTEELKQRMRRRNPTADSIITAILRAEGPKYRDEITAAAANCPSNLQRHADETIKNFSSYLHEQFLAIKNNH